MTAAPRLSAIEQLAAVLGWRKRTTLVMLHGFDGLNGFFDESGEKDPATGALRRLTLGGFIAPWERVQRLSADWDKALEAEGLGSFHMREILSDEDRYDSWDQARRVRLDRFVDILCEHVEHFCGYAYAAPERRGSFRETYETALARTFLDAAVNAARTYGEKIHLLFAKTPEISGQMIGQYFDLVNWNEERISGYGIALAEDRPPLQAAEIVARGVKRKAQDGFTTHSFGRILKSGHQFDWWGIDP